jgi:hypothetical protein
MITSSNFEGMLNNKQYESIYLRYGGGACPWMLDVDRDSDAERMMV